MFNLTIDKAHTFYVGQDGWLVHNGDGCVLPLKPEQMKHIFRDADGHVLDTVANRNMIQEVTRDGRSFLGKDKYGNDWYAQTRPDGSQVWVKARNGEIINGGLNPTPKAYSPQTGLQAPTAPGRK
ncbi:MAG: filamentous hemagglutinin family protein [Proteobacteria bacterium]|nr:filamentous hemagglutinin family protein [Pseudomonadota bacterium]